MSMVSLLSLLLFLFLISLFSDFAVFTTFIDFFVFLWECVLCVFFLFNMSFVSVFTYLYVLLSSISLCYLLSLCCGGSYFPIFVSLLYVAFFSSLVDSNAVSAFLAWDIHIFFLFTAFAVFYVFADLSEVPYEWFCYFFCNQFFF